MKWLQMIDNQRFVFLFYILDSAIKYYHVKMSRQKNV